jgi:hypothetical protein
MWWPSNFAYRLVAYIGVLGYLVARETRKVGATIAQTIACVSAATILQVGVAFAFRSIFSGRYTFNLWILWIVEGFLIIQAMVWMIRLFDHPERKG